MEDEDEQNETEAYTENALGGCVQAIAIIIVILIVVVGLLYLLFN